MKSFIVLAVLVAAAVAAPPGAGSEADAQVLKNESDNIGLERFSNSYETSNGISHQADGIVKDYGTDHPTLEVRGQYSYPGTDGVLYTVIYLANENGFQPQGAHLPKAP